MKIITSINDTLENLNSSDVAIQEGMIVKEYGSDRFKVGSGVKTFSALSYITLEPSDNTHEYRFDEHNMFIQNNTLILSEHSIYEEHVVRWDNDETIVNLEFVNGQDVAYIGDYKYIRGAERQSIDSDRTDGFEDIQKYEIKRVEISY